MGQAVSRRVAAEDHVDGQKPERAAKTSAASVIAVITAR